MLNAKTFIVLIAILAVIESVFLYVVITNTINYHDGYTELNIAAFNDASYTNVSGKWIFFYWSNDTQLSNTTPNFEFPFHSMSPSISVVGKILIGCYLVNGGGGGSFIEAKKGDQRDFGGLDIIVHESNPYNVVLWVKPTP